MQRNKSTRSLRICLFFPLSLPRRCCGFLSGVCTHCESKASVLGDVPVPREHGGAPASPRRQAGPPEVPVVFGDAESVRNVKVSQFFKNLKRKEPNMMAGSLDEYWNYSIACMEQHMTLDLK